MLLLVVGRRTDWWTRPMDELVGGDQTLVYKPVRYEEYPSEQIRSSTDEAA